MQDRELATKVRTLALNQVYDVLYFKKLNSRVVSDEFQEAVLLKLAATILPRLNEHAGEGGGAINLNVTGVEISVRK